MYPPALPYLVCGVLAYVWSFVHASQTRRAFFCPLQNRLMKFFARQLLLKHQFLRQLESENGRCVREAEEEINTLIDLGLFLSVADLETKSIQVCVHSYS